MTPKAAKFVCLKAHHLQRSRRNAVAAHPGQFVAATLAWTESPFCLSPRQTPTIANSGTSQSIVLGEIK